MLENQEVFYQESIKENQIEKLYEWTQTINAFLQDNIINKTAILKEKYKQQEQL